MPNANDGEGLLRAIIEDRADGVARLAYADWLEENARPDKADALRRGVAKRFGVDFHSPGGALTLSPDDVGTHDDGWTVGGEIREDWYEWVNDFEATHPAHGLVWGDFESVVFASSEAGFQDFLAHHPPSAWDYYDI